MDRRNFICGISAGTAASLSRADAAPNETRAVTYKVKGFTCVTCAVGLEVMLKREKGVVRAQANYSENKVAIGFDEGLTSEKAVKQFIASCGFSVA